jgi:hypothetical protein
MEKDVKKRTLRNEKLPQRFNSTLEERKLLLIPGRKR